MNKIKVCLIGGPESGKSCFVKYVQENFNKDNISKKSTNTIIESGLDCKYYPTMGVNLVEIKYEDTTIGLWDTAGVEKYKGFGDGYYLKSNAAIAFYTEDTFKKTTELVKDFKRVCPGAAIIHVWNKIDLQCEKDTFAKKSKRIPDMISISIKNNINCDEPMMILKQKLIKEKLN